MNRKHTPSLIAAALAFGAGLLAIGALAVALDANPTPTRAAVALEKAPTSGFADVIESCDLETSDYVVLDTDGNGLSLDMQGEDDWGGVDFLDVACVLGELDTPESTLSLIYSTSSLDGRVTDEWDGYAASWKYHPNTGLDLVVTFNPEEAA